jgi:hypothetical protein
MRFGSLAFVVVFVVGGVRAAEAEEAVPARARAVLAAVDEIREEVSRIRGLPWKRRVEAEVLSREELGKKLDQWFREDVDEDELEKSIRGLRRFGMLREDEDLLGLFKSLMAEGILAYYDPDTTRIYVVLGPSIDALRPTICHELIHALEDQHASIQDAKDALEDDAEALWGLECVLEGSAERGRVLWEIAHPDLARRARAAGDDPRVREGMKSVVAAVPAYLILPTQFHYQRGLSFVERLTGSDFPGGMARLQADPPVTSEQVLHPGRYGVAGDGRDHPRRIEWRPDLASTAGPGWSLIDDEPSGELDFALWYDFFLGECKGRIDVELLKRGEWCAPFAQQASEGWDGARVAFLKKEGAPLGIVEGSAWDTPLDAREAAGATLMALRARYGARFSTKGWTYSGAPPGPTGAYPDAVRRTLDYVADGLPGRIQVRDDVMLWLEGAPAETFEQVWEALTWTRFERDARDRWSPATEPHPFAGADWRADAYGVAWRRPDALWDVEFAGAESARARRGPIALEMRADRGEMADVVERRAPAGLRFRLRQGQIEPEEASVRGQPAARMTYDTDAAEGGGAVRNVVVLAALDGDAVLVVQARAPVDTAGLDVEIERALDGFLVAEPR